MPVDKNGKQLEKDQKIKVQVGNNPDQTENGTVLGFKQFPGSNEESVLYIQDDGMAAKQVASKVEIIS